VSQTEGSGWLLESEVPQEVRWTIVQTSDGRHPSSSANGQTVWLAEELDFFFLLLPLMNWMSICEPFTRTSSQRR
jgi:hypothetical protein